MRIDKYLKVARLIKRREIAKQMLLLGYISINDKVAKPSSEIKVGDSVDFNIPHKKRLSITIVEVKANATVSGAREMYKIKGEKNDDKTREEE